MKKIEVLIENIERVIVGKRKAVERVVLALLADGHILIEDVPGVGKTMLARALSKSINLSFKRIQFTPDLLPSDIIGVSVWDEKEKKFKFREGPIFTNILLADEINRGTPKTQSALLEAMEERQVTVDGITHTLPEPFFVIGTENPIEYEGTFPLPEAQLDRFLMRIRIGYPEPLMEKEMLDRLEKEHPINIIGGVLEPEDILSLKKEVINIFVDDGIKNYIVELGNEIRKDENIYLGPSPRSLLFLMRVSQAKALLSSRDFVIPDDVKDLIIPVFNHRVILKPEAKLKGITEEKVIEEALLRVKVPIDEKI